MDELLGKLTNLGYEFFGVIVPGFLGLVFLLTFWWALGDVPFLLSSGSIPALSYSALSQRSFVPLDGAMIASLVYFVGHLLNWLSRICGSEWKVSATANAGLAKKTGVAILNGTVRVAKCLAFRIPRPLHSYNEKLNPLVIAAATKLGIPNDESLWRRYYPLAKILIAERLTRSLASTYQNKYTLHRCVTAASALLAWTCLLAIAVCLYFHLEPRWFALSACAAGSLVLTWGFSDSYAYHWEMWGNSIVTESYALLTGITKR